MATVVAVPVTEEDVIKIMGIPSNGEEIVVHTRRGTSNRTYTISLLEQNLKNLDIGDDFRKTFLIFLEGMHDLWDTIWDGDMLLNVFQLIHLLVLCALLHDKIYMPSITVDMTMSLLVARPSAQVQEEPTGMTSDIQQSTEEFVEQPSLPSSLHSLVVEEVQNVGKVASCSHSNIPTSSHIYKWTGRLVADFALAEDVDPR
ncbi:hypothetical protein AAG906_007423 [Vitis piasezkii]